MSTLKLRLPNSPHDEVEKRARRGSRKKLQLVLRKVRSIPAAADDRV